MFKDLKVAAIVTAGGIGKRMGADVPKQFLKIGGKTILEKSVSAVCKAGFVDEVVVTSPEAFCESCQELFVGVLPEVKVIPGGKERQDSVHNAIKLLSETLSDEDILLIHDGVRPFTEKRSIELATEAAYEHGAAICAMPVKETIRNIDEGTLDRSKLYGVQTPQAFRFGVIKKAYEKAFADNFYGTDDAGLCEHIGLLPKIVEGSYSNIKITTSEDLRKDVRIGSGYDVHAFAEGRKLILGGVEIPSDKGLLGHSDADVLTHALMDAILGAAALGDIGYHFPDTDEKYRGISSIKLLEYVMEILKNAGYRLGNCDVTVIAQKPKLSPYIQEMRRVLANAMNVDLSQVSIKATTTEKLGFTGREEGIAAEAVCTIY